MDLLALLVKVVQMDQLVQLVLQESLGHLEKLVSVDQQENLDHQVDLDHKVQLVHKDSQENVV